MESSEYENIYVNETSFWWYKVLHNLVERTVKKLGNQKQLTILDAGCGTGRMMEILAKYGQVEGIDFSPESAHFASLRGQKVEIADLNTWSETEKYDIIVSLDVLYHSGIINDLKVIQNFYKALKPGGFLILNLAAFEILRRRHDLIVHTARRYRRKKLTGELKKIGFIIKKATYRLPHIFLLIVATKMIPSKVRKSKSDVQKINPFLNWLLGTEGIFENLWIQNISSLPFGSSLYIVAVKPK